MACYRFAGSGPLSLADTLGAFWEQPAVVADEHVLVAVTVQLGRAAAGPGKVGRRMSRTAAGVLGRPSSRRPATSCNVRWSRAMRIRASSRLQLSGRSPASLPTA